MFKHDVKSLFNKGTTVVNLFGLKIFLLIYINVTIIINNINSL